MIDKPLPEALTFDDVLPLDAQSDINIDLNGPTLGSGYDRVAVTSQVALNGTLTVSSSFTPSVGARFTIMTFPSYTGGFSDIFLPGIGPGLDLNIEVLATVFPILDRLKSRL